MFRATASKMASTRAARAKGRICGVKVILMTGALQPPIVGRLVNNVGTERVVLKVSSGLETRPGMWGARRSGGRGRPVRVFFESEGR